MWEFDTRVIDIIQRTPTVKSFRFDVKGKDAAYQAGQFFFVTIKVDDKEGTHPFSLSSSPTESGFIEFTKRITTHEFSVALTKMKPGDPAHVRGPMGNLVLPPQKRKLAFLSGGIGITPLRSLLRYISDKKENWDVVLLYGNAAVEEIAFREELDRISAQNPQIRIVHVLSGTNVPPDWKGKKGYVNKDLIAETVSDYKERLFFISGPPGMVTSLESQLAELSVPKEQIKRDSFTGYD